MRKRNLTLLAVLCTVAMLAGCIGMHSRTNVLIPAMESSWTGVRADAEAGGADVDVLDQMTLALESRDQANIIALWPAIKISAETGIAELPAGLKASKQERINNFDAAVADLAKHTLF